ncbi:MAG TPA: sulfatase-like hydrolase/transferase [Tepidisphaeraceae bacterium]|nr:sulfatase-like hydrolase/transferase [Tepidisphaeraceae bacterium]
MRAVDRREFLKLAGLSAMAATRSSQGRSIGASAPNILVFLTDDHGHWAQRAYGNTEIQCPNLDKLDRRGVRMTRAFTPCPVCSPARASFFTGRMPSQHGIHDWIEELTHDLTHPGLKDQTLISQLLQSAGYHTALVGKWHCGRSREVHPGFDRWFSYWINQYPHAGTQNFSDQGEHFVEDGNQSELLTDRAIDFLRSHFKQRASDPFFLFVGYVDTHAPHTQAPAELVEDYGGATLTDIPTETLPACHGRALVPVNLDPALESAHRIDYYAAVSNIDRQVGRVLAELEARGVLDNTLIVYTADHGYNAGHHGIWEKGNGTSPQNFLEESIRIPCTISWPAGGVRQDATLGSMVDHCDLYATLFDAAGAHVDPRLSAQINSPGRSYLPQLRAQPVGDWRQWQICEYGNARMIRGARYKLIRRYPFGGVSFPDELYDLRDDPRETVNRIDDRSLRDLTRVLRSRLNRFFARYTIPSHDGLHLADQPECTLASPWLVAVNWANQQATRPSTAPASTAPTTR